MAASFAKNAIDSTGTLFIWLMMVLVMCDGALVFFSYVPFKYYYMILSLYAVSGED
jgi:hypothetical protein